MTHTHVITCSSISIIIHYHCEAKTKNWKQNKKKNSSSNFFFLWWLFRLILMPHSHSFNASNYIVLLMVSSFLPSFDLTQDMQQLFFSFCMIIIINFFLSFCLFILYIGTEAFIILLIYASSNRRIEIYL